MPLPAPQIARKPLHTRSIRVNAFMREDGLMDMEAELIDFKAYDYTKERGGVHRAGDPVHHMWLRITIDTHYTIVDAVAHYDAAPYGGNCTAITPAYRQLVGLNLLRKFRNAVKERFGRTAGCTHMTELAAILPTAAIQAMPEKRRKAEERPEKRPFHLDGCYAMRLDGPAVQEFYPRWYVTPRKASDSSA